MRDGRLDFYKGYLIWSVVLGHCLNALCPYENTLHLLLRTFDLPMFMYISGFLLKGSIGRYNWKQLLLNKLTNIIAPALVWSAISFLFGDKCWYYFLWAVFISSAVVCLCEKILPKAFVAVGLITIAIAFHLIPKNIVNISYLFPFFLIGYYSRQVSHVGMRKGLASLAVFALLFVSVWKPDFTVWRTGGYILDNPVFMLQVVSLRLIIGMAGIYAAILLLGRLYDVLAESSGSVNLVVSIGKETLSFYLLQHIIVEVCLPLLVDKGGFTSFAETNPMLSVYLVAPVFSLLMLLFMYYIVMLIQGSKYTKWLFGFRISLK